MIIDVSPHYSLSLVILFNSQYVSIPVSSIPCFKNGVPGLPLPGCPSIFSFNIAVIQGLLLIRCPIHAFLLSLNVFHIDF